MISSFGGSGNVVVVTVVVDDVDDDVETAIGVVEAGVVDVEESVDVETGPDVSAVVSAVAHAASRPAAATRRIRHRYTTFTSPPPSTFGHRTTRGKRPAHIRHS
jgi:hypothetical protein